MLSQRSKFFSQRAKRSKTCRCHERRCIHFSCFEYFVTKKLKENLLHNCTSYVRPVCHFLQLEDEEALREEEEEALALQREAAEGLRNEDFGAGSSSSEEEEEDAGTLGHAARQVSESEALRVIL